VDLGFQIARVPWRAGHEPFVRRHELVQARGDRLGPLLTRELGAVRVAEHGHVDALEPPGERVDVSVLAAGGDPAGEVVEQRTAAAGEIRRAFGDGRDRRFRDREKDLALARTIYLPTTTSYIYYYVV
jgi:hypothetical protein